MRNKYKEIDQIINVEFGIIKVKIKPGELSLNQALADEGKSSNRSSVYKLIQNEAVIKVGRSLSNCRSPSFEHLWYPAKKEALNALLGRENKEPKSNFHFITHGVPNILLLEIKEKGNESLHWIAALEIFLERKLEPKVRSIRH